MLLALTPPLSMPYVPGVPCRLWPLHILPLWCRYTLYPVAPVLPVPREPCPMCAICDLYALYVLPYVPCAWCTISSLYPVPHNLYPIPWALSQVSSVPYDMCCMPYAPLRGYACSGGYGYVMPYAPLRGYAICS